MSSCSADSKDPGRTSTVSLGSSYQPREMSSPPASLLRVFKTTNCQTGGSHAGSMCPPRERRKGITGGRQLPPCTSDVAASKLSETFLGHSRAPVTTAADIRTYMLYFPVSYTHPAPLAASPWPRCPAVCGWPCQPAFPGIEAPLERLGLPHSAPCTPRNTSAEQACSPPARGIPG